MTNDLPVLTAEAAAEHHEPLAAAVLRARECMRRYRLLSCVVQGYNARGVLVNVCVTPDSTRTLKRVAVIGGPSAAAVHKAAA